MSRSRLASWVSVLVVVAACGPATSPLPSLVPLSPSPAPSPSAAPAATAGAPTLADVCELPADRSATLEVPIDAATRTVIVHRPSTAPPDAPLFLALHGYGSTAAEMETGTGLSVSAAEHGFIVAYPLGLGVENPAWAIDPTTPEFEADVAFLDAIIDAFVAGGCVDAGRVAMVGFSWGGFMSHTVACHSDLPLIAIASVAGATVTQPCEPAGPIAFLAIHGLLDDVVPYAGGPVVFPDGSSQTLESSETMTAGWAERNGCDGDPTSEPVAAQLELLAWSGCDAPVSLYRVLDLEHHWPAQAGDLMWDFVDSLPS